MHLTASHDLNAPKLDYEKESEVHVDEFWQ